MCATPGKPMTTSEIAERFAAQPGYRLVDYLEVGLPVYRVILQASTLLHKKISPLEEFVMPCLGFGMPTCDEISEFLGLDLPLVKGVIAGLIRDNDIALAGLPASKQQALKLTGKGQKGLQELETVVPEDKTIPLHFDALLRKPALYPDYLVKYRQLNAEGYKEIPARPARQPK